MAVENVLLKCNLLEDISQIMTFLYFTFCWTKFELAKQIGHIKAL